MSKIFYAAGKPSLIYVTSHEEEVFASVPWLYRVVLNFNFLVKL